MASHFPALPNSAALMPPARPLSCRLLWSSLPLWAGAVFVPALACWVTSHRLHRPLSATLTGFHALYADPSISPSSAQLCYLLPFGLLAVVCYLLSARANWLWCWTLLSIGSGLLVLLLAPATIHLFKEGYLRDDAPPFIGFIYWGMSFYSTVVSALFLACALGLRSILTGRQPALA